MPRKPGISFKYENILLVSRKMLQTDVYECSEKKQTISPERLHAILEIARPAITDQIQMVYDRISASNPTVQRMSVFAIQMTSSEHSQDDVYATQPEFPGGVVNDGKVLQPGFQPYWHAIEQAGFYPEASQPYFDNGIWLSVRDDDYKRSQRI